MTAKEFFDDLIKYEIPVTIFLVCGVKLQGVLVSQSEQGFLVEREKQTQFIYHHAISTITAGQPVPEKKAH